MEIKEWKLKNENERITEYDEDKKNSQGTFLSLIVQDG